MAGGVLPSADELEHRFTPAEIMTNKNRLLPEKMHLVTGEPVAFCPVEVPGRVALAGMTPQPVLPFLDYDPAAVEAAAKFAPGARPVIRRGSKHVFVDLSVPVDITTSWETCRLSGPTHAFDVMESPRNDPILPAPAQIMTQVGEGYHIFSAKTGEVIGGNDFLPTPIAPTDSVNKKEGSRNQQL